MYTSHELFNYIIYDASLQANIYVNLIKSILIKIDERNLASKYV